MFIRIVYLTGRPENIRYYGNLWGVIAIFKGHHKENGNMR